MHPFHPRTKAPAAGTAGAPGPFGSGRGAETRARGSDSLTRSLAHSLTHARTAHHPASTGPWFRLGPGPSGSLRPGGLPAWPNREEWGRRVTWAWRFRKKSPRLLLLLLQPRQPPWSPGCSHRRRSPQTWRRRERREQPESGPGSGRRGRARCVSGSVSRSRPLSPAWRPPPPAKRAAAPSARTDAGHAPLRAPAAVHHGTARRPLKRQRRAGVGS